MIILIPSTEDCSELYWRNVCRCWNGIVFWAQSLWLLPSMSGIHGQICHGRYSLC